MEDMAALLQYLQKEAEQRRLDDDRRRAEEAEQRRDDDRRRAEEADLRRQEFATFMATLTTRPPSSPPNDTQQPTQNNKPVIKPPPPLQPDATFQQFRDWRRPHKMCGSCGRQGHRSRTVRCPATGVTCDACGKMRHFKKYCRSTKPVGEAVKLQHNAKVAAPSMQTQQRSGARRVSSLNRDPTETTPPVIIKGDQCIPSDTALDNKDMPTGILTPCQDQQLPFNTRTTPAQAREYFLKTYKDVLVMTLHFGATH
ncbi:hypothetical protein Pmani_033773 [Petrolisthes manimaculis]|uniref:CCHC-type domain-containing protein n=1 Tax=Petrolisthes manimaculis TaxID=1843537 RepID=A0AAE1TPT1_9EUCA|nr:hypothetical protein Pmani_033773 [Petrolisthes manimaculis]